MSGRQPGLWRLLAVNDAARSRTRPERRRSNHLLLDDGARPGAIELRHSELLPIRRFLCLTCPPEVLTTRLTRWEPDTPRDQIAVWSDFNSALTAAARRTPEATVIDASGTIDEVEEDVRHWIKSELQRHRTSGQT